jgi:hypothetical protein
MGRLGEAAGHQGDHGPQDHGFVAGGQVLVVADGAPVLADPGAKVRSTTQRRGSGRVGQGGDCPSAVLRSAGDLPGQGADVAAAWWPRSSRSGGLPAVHIGPKVVLGQAR